MAGGTEDRRGRGQKRKEKHKKEREMDRGELATG
jgi:hypothetical protein